MLCILEERFSNYRKAISCKVRKGGTNQKKTGFAFYVAMNSIETASGSFGWHRLAEKNKKLLRKKTVNQLIIHLRHHKAEADVFVI